MLCASAGHVCSYVFRRCGDSVPGTASGQLTAQFIASEELPSAQQESLVSANNNIEGWTVLED